jgi:hypothetical protein
LGSRVRNYGKCTCMLWNSQMFCWVHGLLKKYLTLKVESI